MKEIHATEAWIAATGGPQTIGWRINPLPAPAAGEVLISNKAIGVNYVDTYFRDGTYPIKLPAKLGVESAGVVIAVGADVKQFREGDRVASFGPSLGAYSTARLIAAAELFKLPDTLSFEMAAASMLKCCTVEALVERCAKVEAGWPVLVHAAAGGVGLILVQWLKVLGAEVIGTVSTPEKAQAAKQAGCDHIIFYREEDVAARCRQITNGKGVKVIFDGIGMTTWEISLKSAARRALIVSYGNAGGPVTDVNLSILANHGSIFVTRPTWLDYYVEPEERMAGAARVFHLLEKGALNITIGQRYPLADAAKAHEDLEAGRTIGSTILLP